MATNITTFDETTANRIVRMLREHERRSPEIGNRHGRDVSTQAREIRWGRTTTNYYYPTYPTAGPAYVVEFGDYSPSPDPPYPGATITNTFTAYSPQWQEVAVDPSDGALIAEGTVVRIERHDGRYWIRPASTPSTHPCVFQDWTAQPSGTYVTSGGSPDYFTVGYDETLGSRTDNYVSRMSVASSGDPFLSVSSTGAYRIVQQIACGVTYNGTYTETQTSGAASAGTAHTHQITSYSGRGRVMFWGTMLEYRVGGSGAWTLVPASNGFQHAIFENYDGLDRPISHLSYECYANLTSGWQVRQLVYPCDPGSLTDHRLYMFTARTLMQYLGSSLTADTS